MTGWVFPVRLLHSLLFAGFQRRTMCLTNPIFMVRLRWAGRGLRHSPPIHGTKAKSRAQSGEAGRLHEGCWRADLDGAGIGRSGIGRTLTLELGESSLVASSRPPGANLRPPAGRDIVG